MDKDGLEKSRSGSIAAITPYASASHTPTSAGLLALATGGSGTSIRYASASRSERDATRDDDGSTATGAAG
ncbi:hypothetical protein Q3G72_002289 [Acer saccharum]|nr:hypothetical protein Q3G72_002289 [Acer saccharum]